MTVADGLQRDWQRFTPLQRLSRFAFYLFTVAALVASLRTIDVIPEFLYDAPEQMADLFRRMWPPDLSYVGPTLKGLVETLHIATLGTIIAIVMALPVGLLAARNVTPNLALNLFAKFVFVTSRSINSLVWALLFVAVFGPGPLAGTLAIAFRSIGFTGKLFAEAMEESNKGSIEALTASGASKLIDPALGLLAAGPPRLLVDRAVSLGHQHPRVRRAWHRRRRRRRCRARYRAQPALLGSGRCGPDRDLCRRDPGGDRGHRRPRTDIVTDVRKKTVIFCRSASLSDFPKP